MAPALWNRFPLLQYDTGGYLARWYEGYLVPSRSAAYGLLLNAGTFPDFWLVVIIQAALTVWIVALVLRTHGFGGRPVILLGTIVVLSTVTTLPWLSAVLLTDMFTGTSVLALHLLVLRADALRRWERWALIAFVGYGASTHSATFAVLVALTIAAALLRPFAHRFIPLAGIGRAVIAVGLGAVMVYAANFAVSGRVAWTPGGFALSFGRMLQDGIVTRYLDDHCPDARLRLCRHRSELPTDADEFFWGHPLFNKLGRFAGLGDEMRTIAVESLLEYPWLQLKTATTASAKQLVRVHTGEGVLDSIWHTYSIIEKFTPSLVPAMKAARQQRGELSFETINLIHYPVALISMILLPCILLLAWQRRRFSDIELIATTAILALLGNAVVCGVFANPHDRYGTRIVWIAPLIVMLAALRAWSEARAPLAVASVDGGTGDLAPVKIRS